MPLIRSPESAQVVRNALSIDLGDLRRHADRLAEDASKRAAAIMDEAKRERERLIAGGREQGLAAGLAEGRAQGHKEGLVEGRAKAFEESRKSLAELDAAWQRALGELEAARSGLLASAREDLIALALEIASRIVKRRIELDPRAIADQLEAVLTHTMRGTRPTLRVHPDDLALAREALPGLLKRLTPGTDADLDADPSLARGSCVLKTTRGVIDASIATQLARMTEILLPGQQANAEAPAVPGTAAAPSESEPLA